jgi:hypothetical protein
MRLLTTRTAGRSSSGCVMARDDFSCAIGETSTKAHQSAAKTGPVCNHWLCGNQDPSQHTANWAVSLELDHGIDPSGPSAGFEI